MFYPAGVFWIYCLLLVTFVFDFGLDARLFLLDYAGVGLLGFLDI